MSQYPNTCDSDDSVTPYDDNSSHDEDDIDLDAIEKGTDSPATNNINSNDKKRSFPVNNSIIDYHTIPAKKQKTSHYTDNNIPIWPCQLCTFDNPMRNEQCSICSSPKPGNNNNNNHNNKHDVEDKKEMSDFDMKANDGNNISKLINGLKNVRLNKNKNNNDNNNNNDNVLDSMDGIINKLENLQFDANANSAMKENSKMNNIINKLSTLDVNNDISAMVLDINREINQFIIELQQSLYWRSKLQHESRKFAAIQHRENIDRIVGMLTYFHDNHQEEYNLFQFVNDTESDYKYLKTDYKKIITEHIITAKSNNNIITMRNEFNLYCDYVSQMFPMCDRMKCAIFKRYCNGKDEDEDIFDDKVKDFKNLMDNLHCYLCHTDYCGIIVENNGNNTKDVSNSNNGYIQLKFGGLWYWFYDDTDIKWIPYNRESQLKLNTAWRNNKQQVMVGYNDKYKIQFKRASSNIDPYAQQFDCHRADSFRRAVIYGTPNEDGLLNGIPCEKQPL